MAAKLDIPIIAAIAAALLFAAPARADEPAIPSDTTPDQAATEPADPAKPRVYVTISKETTRITGPLRPDGYVDYVAALNQQCSEGVTPENNAAVPFCQAVGPGDILEEYREPFFSMLGIDALPVEGDCFVPLSEYVKQYGRHDGEDESGVYSQLHGQFVKAMHEPWSAKQYPAIAGWLEVNAGPLELVVAASTRSRWFRPLVGGDEENPARVISALLPSLSDLREMARMLTARAMLKTKSGDVDAAWSDLHAAHRLARLVGRGPTLVDGLYGISVDAIVCWGDQGLLQHGRLAPDEIEAIRRDMRNLPPLPCMIEKIDVAERYMFLDCVAMVIRDGVSTMGQLSVAEAEDKSVLDRMLDSASRVATDWDMILRMGNSSYDRLVVAGRLPTLPERRAAMEQLDEEFRTAVAKSREASSATLSYLTNPRKTTSRRIGHIFITLFLPATIKAVEAGDRGTMQAEVTELGFALAAYRARHGEYPKELAALRDGFVDEVPTDVFADEPLQYKRRGGGFVLYSVGRNRIDDAGRGLEDCKNGEDWDDLAVRVRAAKPKGDGKKRRLRNQQPR